MNTSIFNPYVILILVGAAILDFFAGFFYGIHVEKVDNENIMQASLIDSLKNARLTENQLTKEQNNVSANFEKELTTIDNLGLSFDFDSLRVTSRCASVPTIATRPGEPYATSPSIPYGASAGEINLDGTAKQVKQLGLDLDKANAKILGLQNLVKTYQAINAQ